jgi:hypothetical protein
MSINDFNSPTNMSTYNNILHILVKVLKNGVIMKPLLSLEAVLMSVVCEANTMRALFNLN